MSADALVIFDGTAIVYRAAFAGAVAPDPHGADVGGVKALGERLARWVSRARARHFAVVFDAPGPSFRVGLDSAYKATRRAPPAHIPPQLVRAEAMTRALGLYTASLQGYEADDLMATLAAQARAEGLAVWLVTPDKDLYQLIRDEPPAVRMFRPFAKQVVGEAGVAERIGVCPALALDYYALVGDASDGIAGVPGVGPKSAKVVVGALGGLDAIYADLDAVAALSLRGARGLRDKLAAHEADARLARRLLTLASDAPLSAIPSVRQATALCGPTPDAGQVFEALGFFGPFRALQRARLRA